MKVEFDFPDEGTYKERAMLIPLNDPTPKAFFNIYEIGDIWVKTIGCEGCLSEDMAKCCGKCPMLISKGCIFHLEAKRGSRKPFYCLSSPTPDTCKSWCQQEFKCVKGSYEGKIRKIREAKNIFH